MVVTKQISVHTTGDCSMTDITERVAREVSGAGVANGIVTLFVPGSTCALTTLEFEPGVVHDLEQALERIAPAGAAYRHYLRWGDDNGHAHVRHALLGPSLTIPLVDGKLPLGTWQQIVLIDLDNRPRARVVVVQLLGE